VIERAGFGVYDSAAALRGEVAPPLVNIAEAAPPIHDVMPGTDMSLPRPSGRTGPVVPIDRAKLSEAGFILPDGPVSGLSEEFRIVKRQLLGAKSADPRANRILVCSALPGEGKTYCAVNLALSIAAERDVEVLLVDADFAKPSIPGLLGLPQGPGLMDALADPNVAVEDIVIHTDVPHLSVLPAGSPSHSDTEHLASARTAKVLETLARPGRIILFDSPPVLAASPASVLASHVGQALMVVRADHTSEAALRDAVGLLAACSNIRLLLNGVKFSASGRRFGTYYGQGV
jgi:exopolysaccharide/PEP-CTERM locus tyrosine autokinase